MKHILISLRNLTVSLFAWFSMVWLLFYTVSKQPRIELTTLWQLFALSFSWAVLFTFFYNSKLPKLKTIPPIKKFTLFLTSCTFLESVLIYKFSLFGITSLTQWILFIGIIFVLYAISLGVFERYKRKASRQYTQLLQEYQSLRSSENVT